MEIRKLNQEFSVCKVMDYSLVNMDAEYSFIGKTEEEKSLVCITSDVPPNTIQRDDGWSTYNTDYVLIKKENYQKALDILKDSGYEIVE